MGTRRVGAVSVFPFHRKRATRPESGSVLVVSSAAYKLENFNVYIFSFWLVPTLSPTPSDSLEFR